MNAPATMSGAEYGLVTDEVMFRELPFRRLSDGGNAEGDSSNNTVAKENEFPNCKDSFDEFMAVLCELNKDRLPWYASLIRRELDASYDGGDPVIHEPVWGSSNVCLPLQVQGRRTLDRPVPRQRNQGKVGRDVRHRARD